MHQRPASLQRSFGNFLVTDEQEEYNYDKVKARYKRIPKPSSLDAYFVHLQRMMSECINDEYKKL